MLSSKIFPLIKRRKLSPNLSGNHESRLISRVTRHCRCQEPRFSGECVYQPRKSLRLCLAGLRIRCFDPIAEASQLSDHSRRSLLPRLFGDRGAAFFVTNPLMQDQPDKSTLSMGNGSDRLVVSQAWDRAAIHNFEDASLGPGSSVGRLVEKAPHVTVALRGPMAVVHACTLLIARASAHPRGETFRGGKGFCRGTDFSNDLLC